MQSPVQVLRDQIQEAVIGRFSNSLAMVLNSPITEGQLDMLWPKLYHQSVLCHWNTISNCCRKWMIMSFIHAKLTMKKNRNKSYVPSEDGINTDLVQKWALGITRSAVRFPVFYWFLPLCVLWCKFEHSSVSSILQSCRHDSIHEIAAKIKIQQKGQTAALMESEIKVNSTVTK